MRESDLVVFGYNVLYCEHIKGWTINVTGGNEGFCHKHKKIINIGKEAIDNNDYELMLHEIAHILTDSYHYSDEFERIIKHLNKKYLGN